MLKKRIVVFVTGIALAIAVTGASVRLAGSLVTSVTPGIEAVACHNSGSSGGGC